MFNTMNCWICGKDGTTGEHLIKASDLRSYFGEVSQKAPVYFHTQGKKNIPVGSIKRSSRLKSEALICNECNSSLTQPYDRAWEKLSDYLRSNWQNIIDTRKFNLTNVFTGKVRESLLNVHLFFVKLFGCKIVESNAPIDINPFSRALMMKRPHKDIYIAFGHRPGKVDHKYAAVTPVQSINLDRIPVFASWLYMIDRLAVNVIYANQLKHPEVMKDTWHPKNFNISLNIKDFET